MIVSIEQQAGEGDQADIHYGKAIDYSQFKPKIVSDVVGRLQAIHSEAQTWLPRAVERRRECPLCVSRRIDHFATIHGYDYARCGICNLTFLQTRLPQDVLIEFWLNATSGSTYADAEAYRYRRSNVARPKVDFALAYYQGETGRWLDLGCGVGDMLSVVGEMGWQTLGLEISADCVAFGREHFDVPIRQMTIQDYVGSAEFEERWDVVSAIGYYDAVDKLREELELASGLLRPGGLLFTLSPQHECLSMALALRYPERPYRFICPPGSTNFFSRQTYEYIGGAFGLEPIAYWYMGMDGYDMINHLVGMERLQPEADTYARLQNGLADWQLAIDKMQMSDYVHVLYRKKEDG